MNTLSATHMVFLRRQGLVFVEPGNELLPERSLQALEISLAEIGYAVSVRLRARLQTISYRELTEVRDCICDTLLAHLGGKQKHKPLFRKFPDDIPEDTFDLWCRKVLSHFLQAKGQACLFCGRTGTTHVLSPCHHVVCDHCFDGSNYSACPVCEHHVDEGSPFFKPSPQLGIPKEQIKLKLLDLGISLEEESRALFQGFCARKQAMSPADKDDFLALIRDFGLQVLSWLPKEIPVKENIALLFGTLLQVCEPDVVLQAAKSYLATATDILRLVAAYSGADPALQGQMVYRLREVSELRGLAKFKSWFASDSWWSKQQKVSLQTNIKRFKIAKLPRALRRALLAYLEGLHPDLLTEDMLRHRSYWVWLGKFLHPGEFRKRFPNVARAFDIIRKKLPTGTPAPAFQTFYAKLESAVRQGDSQAMTRLLSQRPGELARRYDHLLRIAGENLTAILGVQETFVRLMPKFSTPVLLTLCAHLGTREQKVNTRVYWPKGQVAKGVFAKDERATLSRSTIRISVAAIEKELLCRFSEKPSHAVFVVDPELKDVIVPFNERTASKSAIQLPRGSTIDVPTGKRVRLFLHWCQPEAGGYTTDLDLSVGFYDQNWNYVGVCSFYQLKYGSGSETVATSAGDLQSAPFPDGATEFVDVNVENAKRLGIRYAVAVLNNYSGMAFEQLERAYAGMMLRDDVYGRHFDPRTVALKFNLQGSNGVFLPFVLDIEEARLHWLDIYSTGEFAFNNVATSNSAIATICPKLIDYFATRARISMYDLVLLHAAARAERVVFRGSEIRSVTRLSGEDRSAFLERLRRERGEPLAEMPALDGNIFAALIKGDMDLPETRARYVLMPEKSGRQHLCERYALVLPNGQILFVGS